MESGAFLYSLVVLVVLHTVHSQYSTPQMRSPVKPITEYILPNSTHVLTCNADGSPEPKYRWLFNGDALSNGFTVNETTGELKITEFKQGQEGDYQCLAENELSPGIVPVAMSAVISLEIANLTPEWPPSQVIEMTVSEGAYVNVTCDNSPDSVPKALYSWYVVQGDDKVKVKDSDRIYMDAEGTLHFIYVKKEDENTYKCGVTNSVLDRELDGSEKHLVVEVSASGIPKTAPRNQFYTNPAKFQRTKKAVLECVFSGNPIPTITWYDKRGEEIKEERNSRFTVEEHTRKLIINDLKEEDEGNYTCNSAAVDEAVISLDVTSGPIWVESLDSQTVPENEDAVFRCNARSAARESKPNTPNWLRNGKPMTNNKFPAGNSGENDLSNPYQSWNGGVFLQCQCQRKFIGFSGSHDHDDKYVFSEDFRVLTVTNLDKSTDFMCFQCNVSNSYGYEFANGCLDVSEPVGPIDPVGQWWIYLVVGLVVVIIIIVIIVIVVIFVRKRRDSATLDKEPRRDVTYSSVEKSDHI